MDVVTRTGTYPESFATGQPVWDPNMSNMSNTNDKNIIIIFSIVNNPHSCHPYMFIIENYPSKIMIMSFWAPAPKSPAENGIPTKALGTSLQKYMNQHTFLISMECRNYGLKYSI